MESLGLSKIAEDRKYYLSIILGNYQINKSGDTLFCFSLKLRSEENFKLKHIPLNYPTNISWVAIMHQELCQALRIQNKNNIIQDLEFSF